MSDKVEASSYSKPCSLQPCTSSYSRPSCCAFPPVYSVAPPEVVDPLVYDGFVDELVEVLEQKASTDDVSHAHSSSKRRP